MIVNTRIEEYIDSIAEEASPLLREIRAYASEHRVPILKSNTEAFLRTLLRMRSPGHILEIGTAIGYSAVLMAEETPKDTKITTIEKYEKRICTARSNIKKAGLEERIELLEGDATEMLLRLREEGKSYDFVFLDAAKGQYVKWLPTLLGLMREGSVLFSDNVLQEGDLVQPRFAIERRDRCIHSRMREFLYRIMHEENLKSSILPVGDGIALSVYIGR